MAKPELPLLLLLLWFALPCGAAQRKSNDLLLSDDCLVRMSAMSRLQQAYCLMRSNPPETRRIERLLEAASKAGDAAASYQLGLLYLREDRPDTARQAFSDARTQGSRLAGEQIAALAHRKANERLAVVSQVRYAIVTGNLRALRQRQAELRALVNTGQLNSPLSLAIDSGRPDTALWLLDHGMPDTTGAHLTRNLTTAINYGMGEVAGKLLDHCTKTTPSGDPDPRQQLLRDALRHPAPGLVQKLIAAGANPMLKGPDGRTALQYAFDKHDEIISNALQAAGYPPGRLAMQGLEKLVRRKASPWYGRPIIDVAVLSGQAALTQKLINQGADPWTSSRNIRPPIETLYLRGQVTLVRNLIAKAPPHTDFTGLLGLVIDKGDAKTLQGLVKQSRFSADRYKRIDSTPLWQAATHAALIWRPLIAWQGMDSRRDRHGRNLLIHAIDSHNPDMAAALVNAGFPVAGKDRYGRTTAWYAATFGDANLLSLIAARAELINVPDDNGQTPLIRAARSGNPATVQAALAAGATIDATSVAGNTALIIASAAHPEIVSLLLQHHADYKKRNANSLTALMVAARNDCVGCTDLLIAAGANPARKNSRGKSAADMQTHRKSLD